jgi:lysophospholipase L1-like esterase
VIVACLGDSITAGSPLWDPDPDVRATIAAPDERSQWHWWAAQRDPSLEFRNHGVYGERTDEIALRLSAAIDDADAIVIQGGINDIAQRRPVETAAQNLAGMARHARARGLRVALVDVLPWPNGDERAAHDIVRLNALLSSLAGGLSVPLLPFNRTLADPDQPHRMRDGLSDDGDHPSVEGHRLLGEYAYAATSL